MSLDIYESLLESCAETGEINYTAWPSILPPLIQRLNHIAREDFPIPKPLPIINPILQSQRPNNPEHFIENPPILPSNTPNTPRTLPPVPPFPGSSVSRVPDSQQPGSGSQEPDEQGEKLPLEVLQLLEQSLKTLRTCFDDVPPHTIQRLSELVLYPTKHYRTLPAWLRALERVVSVSSGADIFPLSDIPPNIGNGIINGTTDVGGILFPNSSNDTRNGYDRDSLGSDESLGGALLTPIPWLKDMDLSSGTDTSTLDSSSKVEAWQDSSPEDEMLPVAQDDVTATADVAQAIAAVAHNQVEGGVIPQREDGAVTQGELIRMEQEAGVVPVPHEDIGRIGDEGVDMDHECDHMPHARGPDLVGTVDMGKVDGEERQVRISSPPGDRVGGVNANEPQELLAGGISANPVATEEREGASPTDDFVKIEKEDVKGTSGSDDGDIVLVDADGAVDDDEKAEKADASGPHVGADVASSATQ